MDYEIVYTTNKNWYARVKNGKLIIEIPVFLKWNKNFEQRLVQKWLKLLEKTKKLEHIKWIDTQNVLLFGESVDKLDLWKNVEKDIKKILLEYITPFVDEYSQKLWYKYQSIRIWKSKTKRWSCSSDQKLMFNINLVHLQTKYIKYVVIHEICHLKHKNHSPKFRAEVEWFLPNYKEIRKEMKKMIVE